MSRGTALFRLGHGIVQDHEAGQPDRLRVVNVVVDALADAIPVLDAVAHVCEGRLILADDALLHEPVEATKYAVKISAVRAALSGEGSHAIDISVANGIADASFPNLPEGALSVGQETVLSIARAFLHRDLDDHALAVIAFSEALIDYEFRAAVWRLVNQHFRGMPSPTLKTLVVVTESPIDVEMHCGTTTGFRFALHGDRFLIRHGSDDLPVHARILAQYRQPFVLFLGAGFSASSRMPLGNTMRDSAIRRLLSIGPEEPFTSEDLAERFFDWVSQRGWLNHVERDLSRERFVEHLTLEQVVRAERRASSGVSATLSDFAEHHDRVVNTPGQAVRDLCAFLASQGHRPILVTTNFDRLIEVHCSVPIAVFASEEDFLRGPDHLIGYFEGRREEIPLFKLHGSIESPETCVVSTAQTESGLGAAKLEVLRKLRVTNGQVLWIYVGTSMRDLDLQIALREEDFARGADERWVEPYLSRGVEDFGRERAPFWKEGDLPTIQDRLITETADSFFSAVREAAEARHQ